MTSSFYLSIEAQDDEEEEQWDLEGVMRVGSDEARIPIFDPQDDAGLNISVGEYTRPTLYINIIGLDSDNDEDMDIYFGFYGVNIFDLTHLGYQTESELFRIIINARWRLRIPEESSSKWQVLYYPDPFFDEIEVNLQWKTPVYLVNLTESVGVNLQYRIDYGINYTLGNFTTFGAGNPIVPEYPTFPEYNVSVPVFTSTQFLGEATAGLYDSPLSFITVTGLTFVLFYIFRKKRKCKTKMT
ncbi:MAG: hypothetical protein KGD64_11240 [Candidatus Heimdallarchaeota archaeon]|nr:hypothetical protein [Candidatus Heimdallarchaeota archaeon]